MIVKNTSKSRTRPLIDFIEKIIDNRGKTPPLDDLNDFPLIESWQVKNSSKYPLEKPERQKYVSTDCYESWFRDEHPRAKDILLTTVGASIPQYCLVSPEYKICIAQNIVGIRGREKEVDQDFLRFYFLSNQFIREFKSRVVTTVQPSIKLSSFYNIKVSLPSLREQQTLGQDLLALTDKIELMRRQNITLTKIAIASFDKFFGAKLKTFKNIALDKEYLFIKGDRVQNQDYSSVELNNMIRYIRVKDMDKLRPDVFVEVSKIKQKCGRHDLLISFDGTVGKMSFGIKGAYSVAIRNIISNDEHYNAIGFKYALFSRPEIIDKIKSHASGTVIMHASSVIKHLSFRLPPSNEVAKFNLAVTPLFDRILLNQQSIVEVEDMLQLALKNIWGY